MWAAWAYGKGRPYPFNSEGFKKFVAEAHEKGIQVAVYFCPGGLYPDCPSFRMFRDEWFAGGGWSTVMTGVRPDLRFVGVRNYKDSFQDYLVHGIKRLIEEYGIDGVYYDSIRPQLTRKNGEVLGEICPVGWEIIPLQAAPGIEYYTIFEARELARRIYTLFVEVEDSFIEQHSTGGGVLAPIASFF